MLPRWQGQDVVLPDDDAAASRGDADALGAGHIPDGFAYAPEAALHQSSPSGFLLDALRRRRAGRRVLSLLTSLLFVGGSGLFAYPFFTDVYTTQVLQTRLEDEFKEITVTTVEEWNAQVSGEQGAALVRIAIPRIGLETLVVEGTSPAALRAGAGHYPNTPLPGQAGNVAIAGHRTTYGRPFNRIDEVQPGDVVWISAPVGDFKYVVSAEPAGPNCVPTDHAACVTTPNDWTVIADAGRPALTLTSCHPKGKATQRIILRAYLAETLESGTYVRLRDSGQLGA